MLIEYSVRSTATCGGALVTRLPPLSFDDSVTGFIAVEFSGTACGFEAVVEVLDGSTLLPCGHASANNASTKTALRITASSACTCGRSPTASPWPWWGF